MNSVQMIEPDLVVAAKYLKFKYFEFSYDLGPVHFYFKFKKFYNFFSLFLKNFKNYNKIKTNRTTIYFSLSFHLPFLTITIVYVYGKVLRQPFKGILRMIVLTLFLAIFFV